MSSSHQLAAVLFTDIVGYSAIMQEDETAAVEKINRFRQALETKTPFFNGRIIQYYGDGCLLIFNSSVDAVNLAKELQLEFSKDPQLPVRIGIHLGDVLFKDGNIFGDAVNIAARIQAMASPGGILISETVQKNIANKQDITTEYLKTELPKNIKDPIRIYNVKTESAGVFARFRTKSKHRLNKKVFFISMGIILLAGYFIYNSIQKKTGTVAITDKAIATAASLAVLPFSDISATKDQEYLGDGIAEEILNVLYTTMKDLKVPGRSSCFAFKGKGMDIKTIGQILKVKNILEGSVQLSGKQLSVRVYLNDAATGNQIWTERYDREFKDIFILQDEIAAEVGKKLELTLYNENVNTVSRTANPLAVELVLKGNFYFNQGLKGFKEAVEYFNKAIETDSAYAYSYIRLGWTYYQMTLSAQYPSKYGFNLARNEIEKALKLKLTAAEKHSAYKTLAYINLWSYNWKSAYDEYQKFISINPKRDDFNAFYQSLVWGKTNDGVTIFRKISEENPVDVLNLRDYAILQYLDRKYSDALQTCDDILKLDSTFSEAFRIKGHIYIAQNRPDTALLYFSKAASLGNQWGQLLTIMTLANVGKKEDAKKLFLAADKMNPDAIPAMAKALILYSIGETGKAIEWLNRSYEAKDFWLASLRVDPLWDPLRKEPGFQKLRNRMNFPQ